MSVMKRTSTLKLKVVFSSTDLKSSVEDAFELYSQLEKLFKAFEAKSRMTTKELSIVNSDVIPQLAAELKKLEKLRTKSSRSRKRPN